MFMPNISNSLHDGKLVEKENENSTISYNVSGTPKPDVVWYKSVNGERKLITTCSGKTKVCSPVKQNDIEVTMNSFVIKNASYLRHDNVTYICHATNVKGTAEQNFTMFVQSKYFKKVFMTYAFYTTYQNYQTTGSSYK